MHKPKASINKKEATSTQITGTRQWRARRIVTGGMYHAGKKPPSCAAIQVEGDRVRAQWLVDIGRQGKSGELLVRKAKFVCVCPLVQGHYGLVGHHGHVPSLLRS